MHGTLIIIR